MNAAEVLRNTREILETANQGYADLTGAAPTRRLNGLRNVAVFGRSVTLVLQKMRGVDQARFDAWYAPFQAEMERDPLMRYFTKLRNEILKEGTPTTSLSVQVDYLSTDDLQPLLTNPPPGAESFFIGDQLGGSGWEIRLPDGTKEKYYVDLPDTVRMQTDLHLPNPPEEHLGQPIQDSSAEGLCALYVGYLSALVSAAEAEFSRLA